MLEVAENASTVTSKRLRRAMITGTKPAASPHFPAGAVFPPALRSFR
jgi:hypothetical protein